MECRLDAGASGVSDAGVIITVIREVAIELD